MRKYRIRKTGEIIDVISYGGNAKERIVSLDYVSYIDSKGEEHPNAELNLYWDLEEIKPNDNTITIPVKADLDDTCLDAYKAELAKELAVKLADKENITSPATADYITDFASRIVDNLKKQSE